MLLTRAFFLVLGVSSCTGRAAFADGGGSVESVAMRLVTAACDDPRAVQALFLSYDDFRALAPRAGVTNPGARITSTNPTKDEYEGDSQYLIGQLCHESVARRGKIVGPTVVPAEHPDADMKLGLDAAHVKYVVETDGVRDAPGHAFLFLRTSAGWRFAWIEQ
jgi:hypothetical protein